MNSSESSNLCIVVLLLTKSRDLAIFISCFDYATLFNFFAFVICNLAPHRLSSNTEWHVFICVFEKNIASSLLYWYMHRRKHKLQLKIKQVFYIFLLCSVLKD